MTEAQEPRKTLLILEDKPYLRRTLQEAFEDRGFRTIGAGSTDEAREMFWRSPTEFDVLVLDMNLEERITGAEFGIEVKQQYSGWSPEFLVWSAFGDVGYLQLALQLGVAAYLRKKQPDESDVNEVVRHVQALMIRRALHGGRPGLIKEIRDIVKRSHSRAEAMDRFCFDILRPELASVLRSRFLILLSDEDGTRCFDSASSLRSLESPAYDELQKVVFGDLATEVPFVVRSEEALPREVLEDDRNLQDLLAKNDSAFIRLIEAEGLRLSLGLLQGESDGDIVAAGVLPDNAVEMARTLAGYIQPALPSTILEITRLWAESDIERRTQLKNTSKYCLYVGQEVISLFEKALREGLVEREERFAPLWVLRSLGEELRTAGELLGPLMMPPEEATSPAQEVEEELLLREVWDELVATGRVMEGVHLHLQTEGDCTFQGRRDYFRSAFSRLLAWLGRRASETPNGMEPRIDVMCRSIEGEAQIRLEDRSRRLSAGLREQLFLPFSEPLVEPIGDPFERGRRLGLYLARVMIEAQSGFLEDRSDQLQSADTGHLFVVRFPLAA